MMKSFYKYFIVFTIIPLLSCEQKDTIPASKLELRDTLIYEKSSDVPFTGREYARVENKIIEYDVVNGVKHGDFRLYYENGNPEIKGRIEHNSNEGKWQYFYENGQIESEGEFINNLPDGIWKWYYRSGKLREEGLFQNGIRDGIWREYDKSGEVIREENYSVTDSSRTEKNIFENLNNQ